MNRSTYTEHTIGSLLTGNPTVMGMSMLKTMILASTLVVTGTAFSTLHSTLPVLSDKRRVEREYGTHGREESPLLPIKYVRDAFAKCCL